MRQPGREGERKLVPGERLLLPQLLSVPEVAAPLALLMLTLDAEQWKDASLLLVASSFTVTLSS